MPPPSGEPRPEHEAPGLRWAPQTVVAPHPSRPGQAHAGNSCSGRRVTVGWARMLGLICGMRQPGDVQDTLRHAGIWASPADPALPRLVEAWWRRGWADAVDTYLWSARASESFFDRGGDYQAHRLHALSQFLASDGTPPRLRRASSQAMPLPTPSVARSTTSSPATTSTLSSQGSTSTILIAAHSTELASAATPIRSERPAPTSFARHDRSEPPQPRSSSLLASPATNGATATSEHSATSTSTLPAWRPASPWWPSALASLPGQPLQSVTRKPPATSPSSRSLSRSCAA